MIEPSRLLHTLIDGMLNLLPDEPAESKRLIDIGEDDAVTAPALELEASARESTLPESGVRAVANEQSPERAAS